MPMHEHIWVRCVLIAEGDIVLWHCACGAKAPWDAFVELEASYLWELTGHRRSTTRRR